MLYAKFVGTPVTDAPASAGRFRFNRILPRTTLSALRTRLSSVVVPVTSGKPASAWASAGGDASGAIVGAPYDTSPSMTVLTPTALQKCPAARFSIQA